MPRRLQVLAGGSRATLAPVKVNDDAHPLEIKTDKFDGLVTVRIKNYAGHDGPADAPYFHDGYGKDVTWSVQFQGRFLSPVSADDLLFGNEFDDPIRVRLAPTYFSRAGWVLTRIKTAGQSSLWNFPCDAGNEVHRP